MAHERLTKTVEVSKETDELAQAIVGLVRVTKRELANGFQPGRDIPIILLQSMQSFAEGVDGAEKLDEELRADPGCFLRAWALAGADIVEVFASHDH